MTLKLHKETLQALTPQEADQAQGGFVVGTIQTYQIFCQPSLIQTQCAAYCFTRNHLVSVCDLCYPA